MIDLLVSVMISSSVTVPIICWLKGLVLVIEIDLARKNRTKKQRKQIKNHRKNRRLKVQKIGWKMNEIDITIVW